MVSSQVRNFIPLSCIPFNCPLHLAHISSNCTIVVISFLCECSAGSQSFTSQRFPSWRCWDFPVPPPPLDRTCMGPKRTQLSRLNRLMPWQICAVQLISPDLLLSSLQVNNYPQCLPQYLTYRYGISTSRFQTIIIKFGYNFQLQKSLKGHISLQSLQTLLEILLFMQEIGNCLVKLIEIILYPLIFILQFPQPFP